MTLCVAVFTLCATACYVKQLVERRRVCALGKMYFEESAGSEIEPNKLS